MRIYLIIAKRGSTCSFWSLWTKDSDQATHKFEEYTSEQGWEYDFIEAKAINRNLKGVRQVYSVEMKYAE